MSMRNRRLVRLFAGLPIVALLVTGCGTLSGGGGGSVEVGSGSIGKNFDLSGTTFTVGSKEFTEQEILGWITIYALQAAGANTKNELGLSGSAVVRQALLSGEIDMYWEYTGTAWLEYLGHSEPIDDPQKLYHAVAQEDLKENGIQWLERAPFNNTYAIAVDSDNKQVESVSTISDWAEIVRKPGDKGSLCAAAEFLTREDGLPGLQKAYNFDIPKSQVTRLKLSLVYVKIDKGKPCNFGEVFATNGRIAALNLRVLEDNKDFFPTYNPALTMRQEVFTGHKQLADIFDDIAHSLSQSTITQLNRQVAVKGRTPQAVAKEWLQKQGFIGG